MPTAKAVVLHYLFQVLKWAGHTRGSPMSPWPLLTRPTLAELVPSYPGCRLQGVRQEWGAEASRWDLGRSLGQWAGQWAERGLRFPRKLAMVKMGREQRCVTTENMDLISSEFSAPWEIRMSKCRQVEWFCASCPHPQFSSENLTLRAQWCPSFGLRLGGLWWLTQGSGLQAHGLAAFCQQRVKTVFISV